MPESKITLGGYLSRYNMDNLLGHHRVPIGSEKFITVLCKFLDNPDSYRDSDFDFLNKYKDIIKGINDEDKSQILARAIKALYLLWHKYTQVRRKYGTIPNTQALYPVKLELILIVAFNLSFRFTGLDRYGEERGFLNLLRTYLIENFQYDYDNDNIIVES